MNDDADELPPLVLVTFLVAALALAVLTVGAA